MGVDIQIYRCRIGMYNCGLGPKLSDKSMVLRDVAYGISTVSAVCFIGILLIMAGIEPNPGPTGTHDRSNPLCENWNRVAYGYRYLKTGLTGFISSQVGRRHTMLKLEVDRQCHDVKPCSECTTHTLLPDHGNFGCNQEEGSICLCQQDPGTRKKCPNNFCGRFYHLIVDDHVGNSPRWSCTDPTKWYDAHFQYAKCFLSTDSSANSVSDLDCTDLLTIVIQNSYIHHSVHEQESFQQCLEDENIIFHSGSFEVTDSKLVIYIDNMIRVLEDKKCLINNTDAQQAIKELHKLKNDQIQISDEDIDGLLNKIESEKTFIFRYQCLLIEIGTNMLRHVFDDKVGQDFGRYLTSNRDKKNKLEGDKLQDFIKNKRITAAQAKFLPPIDMSPSSSNFDITLLTCLLRNVCGMRPSGDPVWINPNGYSTEADITRLRECRNLLSHSGTVFISKNDFTAKWDELCRILNRLNQGLKANSITNLPLVVHNYQCQSIDERKMEEFNEIIEAWEKMDRDNMAVLKRLDDIEDALKQFNQRREDNISDIIRQIYEIDPNNLQEKFENGPLELTIKIQVSAPTQAARDTSQVLLLDTTKKCVSGRPEETDNEELMTATNNMISDISGNGLETDRVEQGSILIILRCSTILALKNISLYVAGKMYQEKLTELEETLSKCVMCPVKLNISIDPDYMSLTLMQIDKDVNKKSVVLTVKCRGPEGVRNAHDFLVKGSSTNVLNKLSEALSSSVGQKIELNTTVDVGKLEHDIMKLTLEPNISNGNFAQEEKKGRKYTFRYQYLLMEVGTSMLRKLFDHQVGPDFKQYLDTHTTAENQFKFLIGKNVITPAQQQYLPPVDNKPSSSFDITLLCCLLRNVCGLSHHSDVVWINPASTDTSVEAYVTRLRECRNNLLHSGSVSMPEPDLTTKWKELVVILNGLNTFCGVATLTSLINDAEEMSIDEDLKQRFDEMLEAWKQMEKMYDLGIGEVMHEVTTVKHTLTGVKMNTDKLQEDMTNLTEGTKQMQEDITGLKQSQIRLEKNLTEEIRETRPHNVMTEQEHMSNYSVKLTDIQKDIIKYYQQHCRTLPVSPLFENKDEHLLNIYKSLTMYSIEQKKDSKQINGYESLFFKEGVSLKQVYITADAGVGKTSFCTCMCLLWSMAMSGDKLEKRHEGLQKDMEYMSKFDFVFYINLRDTSHTHVVNMIMEQLFYDSREKYELAIQSILRDKPCLIILDSLDEWDPKSSDKKQYKLPERIYSDACVCMTTCRPHRLESVRLSHKRDIDQLVEITGLHGDSSQSYIEDVISYMNIENSSNRNAEDFTNEILKCGLTNQLNIPIIISHLVILWFEKPLTVMPRALIYANILEMVFKRAEKRKVKCPSITPSTWQLPVSLSGMEHLNKYVFLLYNVCHLSFRSLFKQDENVSSLVFTRQQLQAKPYCFSIEETDFLCKIGILSKNEVSGCYTEERLKISFIHKSYIEFFTALYITSFDSSNAFSDITKNWKSLNEVLQYENLFLLLAGFSYDRVKIVFDDIHLTISDDLSLCRKNAIFHYDNDSYSEQIKSLQTIINKCYMEVSSTYNSNILLKLEDFIFASHSGNDDITSLKELLVLNNACVKSIYSVHGEYFDIFDQIKNLQCLNVGKVLPADYKKFTQFILENKSTLHTVCIKGDSVTKPLIPELPVRSLQHLTSLSLSCVKMQHNSLQNLVKFLSDKVLIENIKLSFVYCDNHQRRDRDCTLTLNLPHHTKLTSLDLWYVNLSCNNVNNSSLKFIALSPFSERIVSCYIDVFNCIKDSQLDCLYISGGNWLDDNAVRTLIHTVNTLPCIKFLALYFMKLPDDVLLQLHPHVTQVTIRLHVVTMSRQCFHSFIENFVNNKTVIEVWLYECKITSVDGETHRELSVQESLDDMSEYLTSIPTVNITVKGEGLDGLVLRFETTICQ